MPEEAGDIHLTIVVLKATGLTSKSTLRIRSKPNGYVTIKWALGSKSQEHRTRVIEKTTSPEWNQSFQLLSQTINSTILFEMFDNSPRHSYGVVEKTVRDLLAGPELDIAFPSDGPVLSITVKEIKDTYSAASDALVAAQETSQKLYQKPDQPEITVSCYAPLEEVVASLDKFVKIADTLAEIHPYIKAAWSAVSVAYNVVKDQLERDDAIRDLLETVAKLYGHASLLKNEGKELNDAAADVIKQIMKQTIECSIFIQEYSGKGFAAKAIKNAIVDRAGAQIEEFNAVFRDLSTQLDRGLSVQTALVSIRIARGVADLATKVDKVAYGVDMLSLKDSLSPAQMNWPNRPVCHPLTRIDIRSTISKWIVDPNETSVLWISGYVGSGKSTIATTIANFYADTRRLGAFVFFQDKQTNPDNFVSTLAYELSKFDQAIAKRIADAIADGRHSTQGLLDDQFKYLIHQPLRDAVSQGSSLEGVPLAHQGPIVIVIDALDECGDKFTRKRLLNVLAKETANFPPFVRMIVTSRPESDIRKAFGAKNHIKLLELEVLPNDADISVYLESQLKEIAEDPDNNLDERWPGDANLQSLVSLAGGLFIWASTACKYINTFDPNTKLEDLLRTGVNKGTELDVLYLKALDSAGDWSDDELRKIFQAAVGTILVVKRPMTTDNIDKFLKLVPSQGLLTSPLRPLLSRLGSVIHQADNEPVRIFHKSFNDFITDPGRCTNLTWFINLSHHEHCAALNCIARMKEEFKTTSGRFALSITPEVDYDEAVKYSCSYWIHHVVAVEGREHTKMAKAVYDFMKDHILHWLEARSILGTSRSTPTMLEQLYRWALNEGMDDLKSLAYDTYRFAVSFEETIAKHPAMVAQVALPFAPLTGKLYQLFHNPDELPTVMGGYQWHWPPLLRTFYPSMFTHSVSSVTFSPDMSNIAAVYGPWTEWGNNRVVQCWETFSGTEAFPGIELEFASITQFSADGTQIWIASEDGSLYVLDAVTGDQLSELPWDIWMKVSPRPGFYRASLSSDGQWAIFGNLSGQLYVIDRKERKLAYDVLDICSSLELDWTHTMLPSIVLSPDNSMFAAGSGDGNIYVWQTDTGNKLHTLEGHKEGPATLAFSSEGGKLYSISDDGNVRIWSFTTTGHRSESSITIGGMPQRVGVKTLSADGRIAWIGYSLTKASIRIWDATTGEEVGPVLEESFCRMTALSFSRDGRTLVSAADRIRTWDVSGFGRIDDVNSYSLSHHGCDEVAFSPSGLIFCPTSDECSVKLRSSVTRRWLKTEAYDCHKSTNFIAEINARDSADEKVGRRIGRRIQDSREEFHDAPDTLLTAFGEIVGFGNPQFHSELLEVERGWEAKIKVSTSKDLTWTQSHSRIIHHPQSVSNEVGAVRYDQEIWRPPLELGGFCCDIQPNFIALALNTDRTPEGSRRTLIVNIPESLAVRNTQPA